MTFKERTDAEILERIEAIEESDWFGFQRSDLIGYLSFDAAKPFLKESITEEEWQADKKHKTADAIKSQMLDYMPFAWEKANDRRGISAGRSLNHMQAWLWMLGEDEAAGKLDNYSHYGKPHLRAICEAFEWDWREWDDGAWTSDEAADGMPAPKTVSPLPVTFAASP